MATKIVSTYTDEEREVLSQYFQGGRTALIDCISDSQANKISIPQEACEAKFQISAKPYNPRTIEIAEEPGLLDELGDWWDSFQVTDLFTDAADREATNAQLNQEIAAQFVREFEAHESALKEGRPSSGINVETMNKITNIMQTNPESLTHVNNPRDNDEWFSTHAAATAAKDSYYTVLVTVKEQGQAYGLQYVHDGSWNMNNPGPKVQNTDGYNIPKIEFAAAPPLDKTVAGTPTTAYDNTNSI